MYMKLAGGILWYEYWVRNFTVLVWMKNGCTESHFDIYSVENKNKISTNKKDKLNKDYLSLFLFSFKIIRIFKNPI